MKQGLKGKLKLKEQLQKNIQNINISSVSEAEFLCNYLSIGPKLHIVIQDQLGSWFSGHLFLKRALKLTRPLICLLYKDIIRILIAAPVSLRSSPKGPQRPSVVYSRQIQQTTSMLYPQKVTVMSHSSVLIDNSQVTRLPKCRP